jgi:hypothetical protein
LRWVFRRGTISAAHQNADEFAVKIAAGAGVRGVVVDANGRALSGAIVRAEYRGEVFALAGRHLQTREVESDAAGAFSLEGLADGDHMLSARAGGLSVKESHRLAHGASFAWHPVLAGGESLGIRLVDDRGLPVEAWEIDALPEDAQSVVAEARACTGLDGRCELKPLRRVAHRVRAYPPALRGAEGMHSFLASLERDGIVPAGQEVTVVLSTQEIPSCRFIGRALDTGGRPVQSVQLIAVRRDQGRAMVLHSHSEDGRFEVGPLSPGTYTLALAVPGHEEVKERLEGLELARGETIDVGDVRLPEPATVVVRVRTEGDAPLINPMVELCPAEASAAGGYLLAREGVRNVFRSESVPARAYELRFFAANAVPEVRSVIAPSGADVEVEIEARFAACVELRIGFPTDVETGDVRPRGDIVIDDHSGKRVLLHLMRGEYDDVVRRLKRVKVSLAPGKYRVTAQDLWTKRTGTADVEVGAGTEAIVVDLKVM